MTSDIFDPAWEPGRRMKRKAGYRARTRGIPFEQALAEVIEIAKDGARADVAYKQRLRADARELRPLIPPRPYPRKAQSVVAIPTGFETSRRRH